MPILAEPKVSNHLRQLRLARGIAQYALAVREKVSPTVLGSVVRAPVRPATRWMRVVSRASATVIIGRMVVSRRAS